MTAFFGRIRAFPRLAGALDTIRARRETAGAGSPSFAISRATCSSTSGFHRDAPIAARAVGRPIKRAGGFFYA
jgi:hypothetical protein